MVRCCKTWDVAKLNSNQHEQILSLLSRRVIKQEGINAPIAINRDGTQLYIANHYEKIYAFSDDLDISNHLPIDYQNPTDSNTGIAYTFGFAFDSNSDKVAICSWSRHVCRVYNKLTGDLLYQIGTYNNAGDAADGKLYYPKNPLWLPSGNLLICSFRGTGIDGANAYGHVTEYDATTGAVVETWLKYSPDVSHLNHDVVKYPIKILLDSIDSNILWVAEYYRGRLLKFDITTKLVVDFIVAPIGYSFNLLWTFCFLSNGTIAIASQETGLIVGMNPTTKQVVFTIDVRQFGISADIRDIIELQPGYLAVATWSAVDNVDRAVRVVPIAKEIVLTYTMPETPEGYEIAAEKLPTNFNASTGQALYNVSCLHQAPSEILIPYRNVC